MKLYVYILGLALIHVSCDNSQANTQVVASTTTTTNNSVVVQDTVAKEATAPTVEEQIISAANDLKGFYEDWEKEDSIREATKTPIWVYVIGDSYDDDKTAAQEAERFKATEKDVYVFRKKRKRYYIIKGIGLSSRKQLDDSLAAIQQRLNARLAVMNLSKSCRLSITNTDPIEYKQDGEQKYADCKKCE